MHSAATSGEESEHAQSDLVILRTLRHIQGLLNLEELDLVALRDSLLSHIRSLEALDISGKKYDVISTPLMLSEQPESVRMEWALTFEHYEGDFSHLLQFLNSDIRRQDVTMCEHASLVVCSICPLR